MKRKLFFSVLMVVLVFFVTSICFAGQGKNKGSGNSNKQSLETSTQGKERAEQRQQMTKKAHPLMKNYKRKQRGDGGSLIKSQENSIV